MSICPSESRELTDRLHSIDTAKLQLLFCAGLSLATETHLIQGLVHHYFIWWSACLDITVGDLGRTGGTVPPKFEVGDGPCIRPPNILTHIVIGCEAEHELSKIRVCRSK